MKSRSYLDICAEPSTTQVDLSNQHTTSLTKVELPLSKVQARRNSRKIAPTTYRNSIKSSSLTSLTSRKRLGNILLSKGVQKGYSILIWLFSGLVALNFTLDAYMVLDIDLTDKVSLVLIGLFLLRPGLSAIAIGWRFLKPAVIAESLLAFSALISTYLRLSGSGKDWDSVYFAGLSRLFKIILTYRLLMQRGKHSLESRRTPLSKNVTVELVADKAQEILKKVLDQPWLQCDSELFNDVLWVFEAIAGDRLGQTIVLVSDEMSYQSMPEGDILEIVNGFSRKDSNKSRYFRKSKVSHAITELRESREITEASEEVLELMELVDLCEFNIFRLKIVSNGNELPALLTSLCRGKDLLSALGISYIQFIDYIRQIQSGYNSSVLYHNATHAADVTQTLHYFIYTCEVRQVLSLSPLEIFAAYMAASVHDYEHPGLTNSFLVATQHDWAVLYNDKSVLENHHVSAAFAVAKSGDFDIYAELSQENFSHLRAVMIAMVLATDPINHFTLLSHFRTKFTAFGISQEMEDRQLCLEILVHAADISNPAKPWDLCHRWANLILNEFWLQGDREKKLGIPVSYLADRTTTNIPKSQIGFIDVIVEPLFLALRDIFPAIEECCEHLCDNREKWREATSAPSSASNAR